MIDGDLALGLITNTSAVLAMTLGKSIEGIIGSDIFDASGKCHVGITNTPIPILKGTKTIIKEIRDKIDSEKIAELLLVDFSYTAQKSKTYTDYEDKLSTTTAEDLEYLGIALYGDKKDINRFTGNLPLLK
ncbi:DUF2000 domain-containing protein [Chroococcidiopsidales cyanobacterium LEGE 13417]|nr:DUF2000 domain-containing protein [Chroococcidiopsidales cyanobacterium LEGE 13417]